MIYRVKRFCIFNYSFDLLFLKHNNFYRQLGKNVPAYIQTSSYIILYVFPWVQ